MRQKKKHTIWKRILIGAGIVIFGYIIISVSNIIQSVHRIQYLQPLVEHSVNKYHMQEYTSYINAIIYTESAGKGVDVMQASESKYGTQHGIQTAQESIDTGVSFFREAVQKAKQEHCDILTAIQAYNFGLAYIDYIAQHGGKSTLALAENYSKRLAYGATTTKETYHYWHWEAILYNGGYLYRNGGNFFYAKRVQSNMLFLEKINQLLHLISRKVI